MRQIALYLFLCAIFACSSTASFGQGVDDGLATAPTVTSGGNYFPRANSTTAMRNCGMTEYSVQSMGYKIPFVLTEPLVVEKVQYCADRVKKISAWTDHLKGHAGESMIIPAGFTIWIDPTDPGYAYAAGCLNKIKAVVPQLPVKRPPPPPVVEQYCVDIPTLTIRDAIAAGITPVNGYCKPKPAPTPTPTVTPTPTPTPTPPPPPMKEKRKSYGLYSTICGSGVGALISGLRTHRVIGALEGAGLGAAGGYGISRIPGAKPYYGCAGGLLGWLIPNDEIRKIETANRIPIAIGRTPGTGRIPGFADDVVLNSDYSNSPNSTYEPVTAPATSPNSQAACQAGGRQCAEFKQRDGSWKWAPIPNQ